MKEHITFSKDGPASIPDPVPSSRNLPDWFKTLELSIDSLPIPGDKTAKLCMPLNDAMKMGWLLRAPCDIYLQKDSNGLQVTADREGTAVVLDADQPDHTRNSSFLLPECLVSSFWGIDTPAGYATLVTQPLNRDELRFTVPGMLVPTDEYDGTIEVPMYIEDEELLIQAGDPIAQIIPTAREDLSIEPAANSFERDSKHDTMLYKTLRASSRRKDVYRKDAWVPKPTPRIVEDPEALTDEGTERTENQRSREPGQASNDGKLSYYCYEEQYDNLPAPVPAGEYVPDWYSNRLNSVDELDANQPTSEWIKAATEIGAVVPLPVQTTFQRTGGDHPVDVTAENEQESPGNVQFAKKMGDSHPLVPASVINLTTKWLIRPPSGYSVLVCSPFAHLQRYYRSYAGLADFDRYATTANTPGLFTERVDEWTFPAETAVSQHVPIKRENIIALATIER